jgi:hypothetical protein
MHDTDQDMERLLDGIDGSGTDKEWKAVFELRARLGNDLPDQLLSRYRQAKKWQVRSSCVYHAVRYAKDSGRAVELALLGVKDKARVVRYRACMLLACSLRNDLVPTLRALVAAAPEDTKADLLAAIDAIESQNQNYFVDRDHSGMTTLNVR